MIRLNKNRSADDMFDLDDVVCENGNGGAMPTPSKPRKSKMCPYCHNELDELMFRAKDPVDMRDLEKISEKIKNIENQKLRSEISEDEADREIEKLEKELRSLSPYVATPDEKLIEFWTKTMKWGGNKALREFNGYYAEIDNAENGRAEDNGTVISEVRTCILTEKTAVFNEDGSATDFRGKTTTDRICPHCHSILPGGYEENEVVFIAVIGKTGSGKTVMLSRFMSKAFDWLPKLGVSCLVSSSMVKFCENKVVEEGKRLPKGTTKENYKPPIFMNIKKGNKRYTLVFYDIAGENCVLTEYIKSKGFFIKNADGIIMLVTPEQIDGLKLKNTDKEDSEEVPVSRVFSSVAEAYAADGKCDASFAVTLSQSDVLKDAERDGKVIVKKGSNLLKNIVYKNKKGFMIDQHRNISGDVADLFSGTALGDTINDHYNNVGYFAVSALGRAPIPDGEGEDGEKYYKALEIKSVRVEEPLAWLLYKLGIVKAVKDETILEKIIGFLRSVMS